ncbi:MULTISPECIES: DUF294 nucleotidyltransferase-like domain-containing protein [unclassified Photobacterium]|uniref:DUF294 nucleotidyltransferase-like domain-containing protein n=1 Tax=unclassified Photobacterium TaxID=2628852 RepID=UPI001EDF2E1D|nr:MULTISPECIES: DUF294 nucleotidyltransferase-like domain-containing protein [unclassified Photobacterium]MCG3864463.1 cyclic nucleotide-binding/CBS domain-containing protein [Photobacterium sp. Ph6]MCG3875953.1 cyclic nucleotide-binding/CBS domain-containing protein [Photobacterium sp. Ph5]
MEAEQIEILNFISQYPPFDTLPEEQLHHLATEIEVAYHRANTMILNTGDSIHDLFLIRSGAVEIYRRKGELYNRLDEGDIFGQMGLLMNNRVRMPAKALEDTLLYCIPNNLFIELCDKYDSFADFVEVEDGARLRHAVSSQHDENDLTTSKLRTLITRDAVIIDQNETIQTAAQTMAEEGVSALLLSDSNATDDDDDNDYVTGIITDRDLCTRVLAEGVSTSNPVSSVMTAEPITLDHNAYVFEAMLTMLRYNIHHLPVLRNKQPVGVISVSDIVRYESQNSLLLVSSIYQQQSVEELIQLSAQVKDCFVRMVNEDANSHMIGSAMAEIGRSFKQRLLELAEEKLGPPPIQYCFLALGSMARDEQLIVTDQDNAIILDNSFDHDKHNAYFEALATFVCDGLAACGYSYCTGGIMATNPEWRKTRHEWEQCFADWIDNPKPQALLNSSIFFDLGGVWGRLRWAKQLNGFIVRRARNSPRFLACLARNAINRTPPLGFFKDFVMEKDGRHNNSINLKRRGTAPLADLIRVHALAVGSRSQNSLERLDDIIESGILPPGRAQDLRDAMEYISLVRIRHQALDVEEGQEPDNSIEPENMSDFERRNLKDAFQILSKAQNFVKYRYQATR